MIKSPCNKKETSKINSDSNETYTIKPVGEWLKDEENRTIEEKWKIQWKMVKKATKIK